MVDRDTADLPDGTDKVIAGAAETGDGDTLTAEDNELVTEREIPASRGDAQRPAIGGGSADGLVDRLRTGREQLSSQAGERARGLVTQGLERTSEALANVSRMIGDTAAGIDERLGEEYGDYARRAAGSIEQAANSIASKDPDELIEDTRNFVRNSPGVALAGAAVVGFVVARLLKTGIAANGEDDD